MPIEFDDRGLRVFGHNVKGLQFYDWDRVLQQEIYLQDDNTLNIGGEAIGGGPVISAGAWLGDDGGGVFRFQPDVPVLISGGIVTEYPDIVTALGVAGSGDSVVIPPGTYDESITLVDGVRVVELVSGTVVIDSTSADVAVTTASGGYINVKEIRCTRATTNNIYALRSVHSTGTCVVVAELIRCENTEGANAGNTYAVYQSGAGAGGTLWVFAGWLHAISDGDFTHVVGAYTYGTQYISATQVLAEGLSTPASNGLAIGAHCQGGEQHIQAQVRAESESRARGAYCLGGVQTVWGDCIAINGPGISWAEGAYVTGGLQIVHGNAVAEGHDFAVGGWVQGGTQIVYGDCSATTVDGISYGTRNLEDNVNGHQEVWGNSLATGGSTSIGAFTDLSSDTGVVTLRVHGDVVGDDYGAKCEEGTLTITDGRASGGTYDLWQTGGTLQVEGVQYDSYSGTITILSSSLNALLLELEDTTELTIAAGAVTITQSYHRVDTQNDDATDDLDTVNGGVTGQILVLRPENDARTVVVKHNTGNIWNPSVADVTLDDVNDHVLLLYDGSKWCLLAYEGTVDHGALDGLADDDHEQYSLVDGTREYTGPVEIDIAAGDPTLALNIGGSPKWMLGVDDDDEDKFKINSGGALADPSKLELDDSGNLEVAGNVKVGGGLVGGDVGATVNPGVLALYRATGDPKVRFDIGGVVKFLAGIDDTDDRFKINTGTTLAVDSLLALDDAGNLELAGDAFAFGGAYGLQLQHASAALWEMPWQLLNCWLLAPSVRMGNTIYSGDMAARNVGALGGASWLPTLGTPTYLETDPAYFYWTDADTVDPRYFPFLVGWFYFNDATTGAVQTLASKWGGAGNRTWILYLDATGHVNGQVSTDGTASTTATTVGTLSDATWHHIAFNYDYNTGDIDVWVDKFKTTANHAAAGALFNGNADLVFCGQPGGALLMDGRIVPPLALGSVRLTQAWVNEYYTRTSPYVL